MSINRIPALSRATAILSDSGKIFLAVFLVCWLSAPPAFAGEVQEKYEEGLRYMRTGRIEEAILSFERAVELRPDLPELLYVLGIAYLQSSRTVEAAEETLKRVIELDENHVGAYTNLAIIYQGVHKDYETAKEYFESALRVKPDDERANFGLGWIYLIQKKDALKAIPYLEQAVAANPGNAQALYHLGMAYFQTGQTHRVIKPISSLRFSGHDDLAGRLEDLMSGRIGQSRKATGGGEGAAAGTEVPDVDF